MFIIVPLSVIAVALAALVFIAARKWPYLRKLEPDAHTLGSSFFHDLAPEAAELRAVHWKRLWHTVLTGIEGAAGGIRSLFTAIERASERMMRSIRSSRKSSEPTPEPVTAPESVTAPVPVTLTDEERTQQLKKREQELIVEIAQDPKDTARYRELSDIYVKLENITDAVEALKAAAKLEPENKRITERLTQLTERLERQQKKEAERVQEQEPTEN